MYIIRKIILKVYLHDIYFYIETPHVGEPERKSILRIDARDHLSRSSKNKTESIKQRVSLNVIVIVADKGPFEVAITLANPFFLYL